MTREMRKRKYLHDCLLTQNKSDCHITIVESVFNVTAFDRERRCSFSPLKDILVFVSAVLVRGGSLRSVQIVEFHSRLYSYSRLSSKTAGPCSLGGKGTPSRRLAVPKPLITAG